MNLETIYERMGISREVYAYGQKIEKALKERFAAIDETAEYNQLKVLQAMQECRVSDIHFAGTSGYGYNDLGRDTLEAVYAKAFHAEAALVRPQITCGTHALAVALGANLRPGDELLAVSGKPYDTLEEVIGIRPSSGSLAEYGITYRQVDLMPDDRFDLEGIRRAINEHTKMVHIQRSKGYQTRRTLSVADIKEAIAYVKSIAPHVICMVDNCYGEFVERLEPTDVGADLCAYRRIHCRKRSACGTVCLPIDVSRTWQRGRSVHGDYAVLLSGIFPGADGDGRGAKRGGVCGQHL